MKTSGSSSYLLQNRVQLFVGWTVADFQPRVRVVFVAVEHVAERFHAVPAGASIVGHSYDMRPTVHVGHRLESHSHPGPRPGDAHHRIIGRRVVKIIVAAPLRKERTIPVGRDVTAGFTHYKQ